MKDIRILTLENKLLINRLSKLNVETKFSEEFIMNSTIV